ncbi:MAG TPA: hypothetical protein VMU90_10400 [Solirubrobacteraceae bacterium]|nr:hypothetical protein [Solirubrobacteraceae bacterium]
MKRGLAICVLVLAGCGARSGPNNTPDPGALPLARGSTVVERVTECDHSANAFCGVELVVVNPQTQSSGALVAKERYRLRKSGWSIGQGDIPAERSAASPDGKLRVTYATASGDLLGIDLGWITRSRPLALALARAMFGRQPAMSIMLETGPA